MSLSLSSPLISASGLEDVSPAALHPLFSFILTTSHSPYEFLWLLSTLTKTFFFFKTMVRFSISTKGDMVRQTDLKDRQGDNSLIDLIKGKFNKQDLIPVTVPSIQNGCDFFPLHQLCHIYNQTSSYSLFIFLSSQILFYSSSTRFITIKKGQIVWLCLCARHTFGQRAVMLFLKLGCTLPN